MAFFTLSSNPLIYKEVKTAKSRGKPMKAHCWPRPNPKASDRVKIKLLDHRKLQLLKIRLMEIIQGHILKYKNYIFLFVYMSVYIYMYLHMHNILYIFIHIYTFFSPSLSPSPMSGYSKKAHPQARKPNLNRYQIFQHIWSH